MTIVHVSSDVDNVNQFCFLQEVEDEKEEINILYNEGIEKIKTEVENAIADYVVIYFAGMFWVWSNRMICLKDGEMTDMALLNSSPRQCFIDACR